MKVKLLSTLSNHSLESSSSTNLYIVDYKRLNGGDVAMLEDEPSDIKSVHLVNPNEISINFDGFKDNALPIEPLSLGLHNKQCECVLFPETENANHWVLFIETKYTNDIQSAFNENNDYPNCMISQIVETVNYFRDKKIIEPNRRVHAIVSFPNLISEFNSTFFSGNISEMDILREHKILIRAINHSTIKSEKRISLS